MDAAVDGKFAPRVFEPVIFGLQDQRINHYATTATGPICVEIGCLRYIIFFNTGVEGEGITCFKVPVYY